MTKLEYLSWFDQVIMPTEPTFRRVPPDKIDFRLTESSFSVGQLLAHIAGSMGFHAMVIRQEQDLPYKSLREILVANRQHPSMNVEEGVLYLQNSLQAYTSAIRQLPDDEFLTGALDTPQLGRVPFWRYAVFVIEHHIHHLMELHLSLKVLGIDVNTKTLYRG